MSPTTTAARHLVERYLHEIAPDFCGLGNWERIREIERRFGLVGYADMIEAQCRRASMAKRIARAEDAFASRPCRQTGLWLRDARA